MHEEHDDGDQRGAEGGEQSGTSRGAHVAAGGEDEGEGQKKRQQTETGQQVEWSVVAQAVGEGFEFVDEFVLAAHGAIAPRMPGVGAGDQGQQRECHNGESEEKASAHRSARCRARAPCGNGGENFPRGPEGGGVERVIHLEPHAKVRGRVFQKIKSQRGDRGGVAPQTEEGRIERFFFLRRSQKHGGEQSRASPGQNEDLLRGADPQSRGRTGGGDEHGAPCGGGLGPGHRMAS